MRVKKKFFSVELLFCVLLSFLLLTGCGSSVADVSSEPEPTLSSSPATSSDEPESSKTVFELFADFPSYDPAAELSYEEYFSEERILETTALPAADDVPTGYPSDMPGYQYVKGETSDELDWDSTGYYWQHPYDNLYLMNLETGERTLLAELEGIARLLVFPDRLYLLTDYAVWRCGRLGENLTCVYEHPSRIYAYENCEWSDVLFFETLDTDVMEIWRLYLPDGTAERLCDVEELDRYATGDASGYIPITNEAFLYARAGDRRVERYIYSARTGQCSQLEGEEELGDGVVSMSDLFDWVREHYQLNR